MGSGCTAGDCGCLAQAGEYALQPKALVEDMSSTVKGISDAIDGNSPKKRSRRRREPPDKPSQKKLSGRKRRGAGRVPPAARSPTCMECPKTQGNPWCGMEQLCGNGAPVHVLYANNQIYHAVSPSGRVLPPLKDQTFLEMASAVDKKVIDYEIPSNL